MGFMDRITSIASGFGGAVQAPFGLVGDLITAPWNDDEEYNEILNTLYSRTVTRGADFAENLWGPNEGGGAIAGAVPEGPGGLYAREGIGAGVRGVTSGLEYVGREVIREPIAATMMSASLNDSPTWNREYQDHEANTDRDRSVSGFVQGLIGNRWIAEAVGWNPAPSAGDGTLGLYSQQSQDYGDELAQNVSVGQSVSLAVGTQDILDEEEVREYVGTPAYEMSSGAVDAAFRLFLEPDVFLGQGLNASRIARGRTAYAGSREIGMGSFRATVRPDLGATPGFRHFSNTRAGRASQAVLDQTYSHMPDSLRRMMYTDVYGPADIERLARDEAFSIRQRARVLRRYADRDPNPDQMTLKADLLDRHADLVESGSRQGNIHDVAREALDRDRAAYFNASENRGFLAGFTDLPTFKAFDQELDALTDTSHAEVALDEVAVLRQERLDINEPGSVVGDDTARSLDSDISALTSTYEDSINLRAGLIRDRFFPNHAQGDVMSWALASAKDRGQREAAMRVFLGDRTALADLLETNYALGRQLEDMARQGSTIEAPPVYLAPDEAEALGVDFASPLTDDVFDNPERHLRLTEEMDVVVDEMTRNKRMQAAFAAMDTRAVQRGLGPGLRNRMKSSTLYQRSPLGSAVRVFTDMRPHNLVAAGDDAMADGQLWRMMRESGVWDETDMATRRGEMLNLPMDQRADFFIRQEDDTIRAVLEDAGLAADDVDAVLAHANKGRRSAMERIQNSRYDSEGRAIIRGNDAGEAFEYPLRTTELASVVPVTNMRRLKREANRYARLKYGEQWREVMTDPKARAAADDVWDARRAARATSGIAGDKLYQAFGGASDIADNFMSLWKTTVLLRPAWTMRVVALDEQMRRIAQFGALAALAGTREGFNDFGSMLRENPRWNRWLGLDGGRSRRVGVAAAATIGGSMLGGPVAGLAAGTLGYRILKRIAEHERHGVANGMISGHRVQSAFGPSADQAEMWRGMVSAQSSLNEFIAPLEGGALRNMRRNSANYQTLKWDDPRAQAQAVYRTEWARLMQRHFTQDEASQILMRGGNADDVNIWLTQTAEGRLHAARLPGRRGLEREWADNLAAQVEDYTFSQEVRDRLMLMPNDASPGAWGEVLDDIPELHRQPIHGADAEQVMGRSQIQQFFSTATEEAFRLFGAYPTDALMRNPTFAAFYEQDVARRLATLPEVLESSKGTAIRLGQDVIRTQEDAARRFALQETKTLLYDLAERSRFAEATRMLMPFYPAWQEVMTRWAGLVYHKPQIMGYAQSIWGAPKAAGLVYEDDQGNEFVQFRIPEFARGLLNSGLLDSAVDSQGTVRFDQGGFNLVAQGTPGFGPFVQYAVSQAVYERPELEESVESILPFGPTRGLDPFIAPNLRRVQGMNEEEENRAWANARNRILITQLTQMMQGERPTIDFTDPVARDQFVESVNEEARAFASLRLVAGLVAPVQPIFDSPYQPYIDVYRAMRNNDPERAAAIGTQMGLDPEEVQALGEFEDQYGLQADALFLQVFGEEFYTLTQSFTRTNNGVPPTLEGAEMGEEFQDLIRRYPEWGGTIAGFNSGAAAEFSRAVYDSQLRTPLGPGTDQNERRPFTAEELITEPQVELGWTRYSQIMDQIEMLRVENGYANLNVADAEWLREAKQQVTEELASQYPLWFEEFSTTDRAAWTRTIEGAWAVTEDERLSGREDIRGLADYLEVRDMTLAELIRRDAAGGASTLSAVDNQDLNDAFMTTVADLVERNPAFASLYYRRFSNDPMDVDTYGMAREAA